MYNNNQSLAFNVYNIYSFSLSRFKVLIYFQSWRKTTDIFSHIFCSIYSFGFLLLAPFCCHVRKQNINPGLGSVCYFHLFSRVNSFISSQFGLLGLIESYKSRKEIQKNCFDDGHLAASTTVFGEQVLLFLLNDFIAFIHSQCSWVNLFLCNSDSGFISYNINTMMMID